MIARLDSVSAGRNRRLALKIRNAKNCVSSIVLGPQNEPNYIEIREVEHPANVEIDHRARVIEAHSIVEKYIRSDQSGGWKTRAFLKKVHGCFRQRDRRHVGQEKRSVLHSIHSHYFPLGFFL